MSDLEIESKASWKITEYGNDFDSIDSFQSTPCIDMFPVKGWFLTSRGIPYGMSFEIQQYVECLEGSVIATGEKRVMADVYKVFFKTVHLVYTPPLDKE